MRQFRHVESPVDGASGSDGGGRAVKLRAMPGGDKRVAGAAAVSVASYVPRRHDSQRISFYLRRCACRITLHNR
ncbi:protein of unknown function [Serratia sp. Tan611]|nr:protein of unknown function [Serratia sp. Tan611]